MIVEVRRTEYELVNARNSRFSSGDDGGVFSVMDRPAWWPLPDGEPIGEERAGELVRWLRTEAPAAADLTRDCLWVHHPDAPNSIFATLARHLPGNRWRLPCGGWRLGACASRRRAVPTMSWGSCSNRMAGWRSRSATRTGYSNGGLPCPQLTRLEPNPSSWDAGRKPGRQHLSRCPANHQTRHQAPARSDPSRAQTPFPTCASGRPGCPAAMLPQVDRLGMDTYPARQVVLGPPPGPAQRTNGLHRIAPPATAEARTRIPTAVRHSMSMTAIL